MFTLSSSSAMPLLQFPVNRGSSYLTAPSVKFSVPLRRGQYVQASVAVFPKTIPAYSNTSNRAMQSLYEILKVELMASFGEIKVAYRTLAKIHHPDRERFDNGDCNFMQIRDAYETLSDLVATCEVAL
ncbi:unnamed protein product [Linum tenue]|uniref:J domain-containing protein n=1 Tax=Linum tenue TaxID=586396 RepID=A0AAV0Q6R8_9ROSI|nr:unnamed protein product [Linum tenue]